LLILHTYIRAKTSEWIRMPLEMVSWIGRDIRVYILVVIVEGEGAVLGVWSGWKSVGSRLHHRLRLKSIKELDKIRSLHLLRVEASAFLQQLS